MMKQSQLAIVCLFNIFSKDLISSMQNVLTKYGIENFALPLPKINYGKTLKNFLAKLHLKFENFSLHCISSY